MSKDASPQRSKETPQGASRIKQQLSASAAQVRSAVQGSDTALLRVILGVLTSVLVGSHVLHQLNAEQSFELVRMMVVLTYTSVLILVIGMHNGQRHN